jgi:HD-GYP domain-containing protein (c-di-GMP phosphodiesterase class II)
MLRAEAIQEIVQCSGKQFDPAIVKAFLIVQQSETEMPGVSPKFNRLPQGSLQLDAV